MYSTASHVSSFDRSLAAVHMRSQEQVEMLRALLLSFVYFAFTDIGHWTSYDGVLVSLGLSVILPSWRPYLMLLVLSVHDAPGQADPSIYGCVVGIAAMMIITSLITRGGSIAETAEDRTFRRIAATGFCLAVFGTISSYFHQRWGLHQQLDDRPFWIVGGLTAFMMLAGLVCHRAIVADPWSSPRLRVICVLALAHILVVTLLQVKLGPQFGASPAGLHAIATRMELLEGGERGVARLTGPFLSPNTLAILPAFYMILYLRACRSRIISGAFIVSFLSVGLLVAGLGAARSMFAFYLLAGGALIWTRSPQRVIVLGVCCLPFLLLIDIPFDDILMSMRLRNLESIQSLGTRGLYWQATLSNLKLSDWMLGFGVSHWPVFFQFYTGSMASDPHNWIMSMGGSYGLPGLLFYSTVGWLLLKRSLSGPKKLRAISTCLFLLFIARDLANTQYLVNNHPMSCLYWMAFGSAFIGLSDVDSEEETLSEHLT
ncbi:MAG: O-antigen ligase family protein [Planctomycetaceae bacterium]|nr:O-antigen ligase family protein [Planctomycetaceae bacterium]